jgi:hypothetical protein
VKRRQKGIGRFCNETLYLSKHLVLLLSAD